MFNFPKLPHQAHIGQSDTPIINVPDSPEALDVVLRLIYPVEKPKIDDLSTLTAVFSVAEKYKISYLWPVLGQSLETFLPGHPSEVHIIASRFGLSEVAEEATRVLTPHSHGNLDYVEEQHIASTHPSRSTSFVQPEEVRRPSIRDLGESLPLGCPAFATLTQTLRRRGGLTLQQDKSVPGNVHS